MVRPGNGHWYETQCWAPDGSGFLYTETAGTAINPELFFASGNFSADIHFDEHGLVRLYENFLERVR